MEVLEVYKVRLLDWEVSVRDDRVIFYFQAFTRAGALRKANKFIEDEEVSRA